jgi:hypothetical protein
MAQIGSPPAGWYTDPSGRHRARYWDGAAWTDQVRDDIGDQFAASQPTHPAAATVAGVAEAVATVAASRVIQPPAGGPPLVVGDGTGLESQPLRAGDLSVAAASRTTMANNPAGAPAAGWYPDPVGCHQVRWWDGARWTERVADNGVEAIDLLPGMTPVTQSSTAWGDGLAAPWAGGTDVTGGRVGTFTEPERDATGGDGAPMSAGQASLASLVSHATNDADEEAERRRTRPPLKVRIGGAVALLGAAALLLGSGMTWMEVRRPWVNDAYASTGVDLGDGRITIALALVIALLGAVIVTGRMARIGGSRVAAMGVLVASAAAVAVTAVDIADVADRAARLDVPIGAVTDVGTGLWLAFLGGLIAVGGGLMAFANRR